MHNDRRRPAGAVKTRRALRLGMASAAAALGLAILLVIPILIPRGASRAAAEALNAAAAAAERQPYEQIGPSEYYYSKATGAAMSIGGADTGSFYSLLVPSTTESWLGQDGSLRAISVRGTPQFLSARDRKRWEDAGADRYEWESPDNQDLRLGPGENVFPFGGSPGLTYQELIALPADPDELLERIDEAARAAGQEVNYERFVVIGDLFQMSLLPPDLQAAIYRTAARIPGVELIGEVEDPVGRRGVAVGFVHYGIRNEMIFDPDTGRLLAERDVLVERIPDTGAAPGTVIGYVALGLEGGIVKATTERPPGVAPVEAGGTCVPVIEGGGDPGTPQRIPDCPAEA